MHYVGIIKHCSSASRSIALLQVLEGMRSGAALRALKCSSVCAQCVGGVCGDVESTTGLVGQNRAEKAVSNQTITPRTATGADPPTGTRETPSSQTCCRVTGVASKHRY